MKNVDEFCCSIEEIAGTEDTAPSEHASQTNKSRKKDQYGSLSKYPIHKVSFKS